MSLPRLEESFPMPRLTMCRKLNRIAMKKRMVMTALIPPAKNCVLLFSNQLPTSEALMLIDEKTSWMVSLSWSWCGAERRTGVVSAGGVSCVSVCGVVCSAGCAAGCVASFCAASCCAAGCAVSCKGFVSIVLGVSGIFQ